jgi:hypothetical protein
VREPALDGAAIREDDEVGIRGDVGDSLQQARAALAPPTQRPRPEVMAFWSAPPCPPCTQHERKIEHDNSVGPTEAGFEDVVWPEVAIHNPAPPLGQGSLTLGPLVSGKRLERLAPEHPVELDQLSIDVGCECACEHGLASATSPQYQDPIHLEQCGPSSPDQNDDHQHDETWREPTNARADCAS